MKKVQFMGYEPQEVPEVETLEEISENGLYAVKGVSRAVEVQSVTQYGKDSLSEQYGNSIRFFTGADGREYYAMMIGIEFLKEEEMK